VRHALHWQQALPHEQWWRQDIDDEAIIDDEDSLLR
jgi:hypothetical protein